MKLSKDPQGISLLNYTVQGVSADFLDAELLLVVVEVPLRLESQNQGQFFVWPNPNLVFESVDSGNFGVLAVCTYQIWSKNNSPPPGTLGGPSCAEKNLGSVWE